MSLLGKILPNKMLASPGIVNFRRAVCNSCEFRKNGFCGTPILGEWIKYKGEVKKLCGCITNEKTELKNELCPLNKW